MTPVVADTVGNLVLSGVAVAAYLAVLWIALAFYVVRDARRRSTSPPFVGFATLLGFLPPFLGALIYLVVRPPRTLDEERALELEEQALREVPDDDPRTRPCPSCGKEIETVFVLCPYCRTQFARRCVGCGHSLRLGWAVCPYCAEDVGSASLSRSGRAVSS
ncbi:MAG: zinc ribbon domain-containing protein [Candidatus Dormibacteria bacterium]